MSPGGSGINVAESCQEDLSSVQIARRFPKARIERTDVGCSVAKAVALGPIAPSHVLPVPS